jgi:hypothetical protein
MVPKNRIADNTLRRERAGKTFIKKRLIESADMGWELILR